MMYTVAKRIFDLAFSAVILVMFLPIVLLLAIWIKSSSAGPVFYRGRRVGLGGVPFYIFKFRTMVINADQIGGPSTAEDDPRITPVGKFIRRYKLDEIPQFLNVLMGDMSIVGPRPEVQQYVDMYTEDEKKILTVKPGITDYASIKYHNEGEILAGSSDPEQAYLEKIRPGKLKLQLQYVQNRSFIEDVRIVFETVATLLKTRAGR